MSATLLDSSGLGEHRVRIGAIALDLAMAPLAWLGAYWLRYNLDTVPAPSLARAIETIPLVVFIHASVFAYYGVYRGVWQFFSLLDLVRIAKAVVVGIVWLAAIIFLLTRMEYVPRSIMPLYAGLLISLLGGMRLLYRAVGNSRLSVASSQRVLIIGSGEAAEMLVRDLLRRPNDGFLPVALVDDNRQIGHGPARRELARRGWHA